jgi:monoamine oxidase
MVEMHDATTRSGSAALFGFLGMNPDQRQAMGEQALTEACIDQFERIFGSEAGTPTSTLFKDWAADSLTCTTADLASSGHPAPALSWAHGLWAERLILAGSEVSPNEAGYLAGAVEASNLAAEELRGRLDQRGRRT